MSGGWEQFFEIMKQQPGEIEISSKNKFVSIYDETKEKSSKRDLEYNFYNEEFDPGSG